MTTHDNATPLPDWQPAPRDCPLPACDVCNRREHDGYGTYPLPAGVELGEN